MVKITSGTWKCVIPHCKSRARAPGHYFPKDTKLRKKWIKAISMSHVPDEKIKKCRICHLHFDESSYVINLQRRRLKIDAIPNQNLPTRNETDNSESDTSTDLEEEEEEEEDEENEDEEMDDPQYDEVTGTIAPQSFLDVYKSYVRTVKHKVILGNNVDIEEQTRQETQLCNNVNIEEGTQQETQPEIVRIVEEEKAILENNVDIEEGTQQETQLEIVRTVEEEKAILENNVDIEEGTQQEIQPKIVTIVEEEKVILENNVDIEEGTQQETQPCNNVNIEEGTQQETQPEIVRTPNRSFHSTNHVHRNILVTRKANLTPVARKIYIKNRLFKKQKIFYARILIINND